MMTRLSFLAALLLVASVQSFTTPFGVANSRTRAPTLAMSMDDMPGLPQMERGVSMDQDGKSNVWAIEPKMEVSSKSSDENGQSIVFAGGSIAAAVAAAAVILSNLPDPSQY